MMWVSCPYDEPVFLQAGGFSDVRMPCAEPPCAARRACLLLGSGPRLRYIHRSELLQDAQVVPARSDHLRNLPLR